LFKQFNKYSGKNGVSFSINRATLAFQNSALEKTFKQFYFESNIQVGRACHLIAIFFYWSVGLWDAIVIDPSRMNIWAWVIPFVTIIFLVGLASSYLAINWYAKYWQQLFAFYVFMTGAGFTIVTVLSSPNYPVYNFIGIIFCLLFCYTFIRLTFIWATIAGNVIIAMYMFATLLFFEGDIKSLFSGLFYMFGVNLLGMMVCYSLELMYRRDFMLKSLLESEKDKTEQMNDMLEQMVEERTEELRVSKETFIGFFSHGNIGMAIASIDKGFLNVNKKFCDILEYSEEELLGKSWTEITYAEDIDRDLFKLNRMISGEIDNYQLEKRFVRKDKKAIDTHLTVSCIRHADGSIEKVLATIQDITDRKQIEGKLKENEQKYRHLIETASDAIYLISQNGQFLDVNQAACKMLNRSKEEFLKFEINSIDPNFSIEAFSEFWRNTPINTPRLFETAHLHKDGTLISVEVSGQKFKIAEKIVFFGIARDITDRKKAQSERDELQRKLTQSQKLESIGNLAGGIAHDFNNMLGVILGHTEMALMQADETHQLHDDLKEVQKAAKRSADITKQLLAFARKQTISPRQLDLNDTVESMLNMLRRLIGEDIDLIWQPASDLWPVKMDPSQIDQILANLCVNARDAISDVGKLTIETGIKTFDEEYCSKHPGFIPGDFVLLAVSDNGCGMGKEVLDNLFEPFFTTKDVGKGTGLGLATIFGIVKQNNGFINVYSEPGQGSTFKIYLPRIFTDEDTDKVVPEKKAAAGGTETILLVEDEPSILRMTRMMLERKGYSVLPAATPGEAIDLAKTHVDRIHLLMTDVVMPEMNGQDLAGQLIPLYPEMKILFMSGYTANVIAHHGVLDDGVAFIQKPFSMADMTEKVREVLDMAPDKS
jgi:PAS domain S-box-containing protein